MNELKQCPFCGCEAKAKNKDGIFSYVMCTNCGCSTEKYRISLDYCATDRAIKAWNRRVDDDT